MPVVRIGHEIKLSILQMGRREKSKNLKLSQFAILLTDKSKTINRVKLMPDESETLEWMFSLTDFLLFLNDFYSFFKLLI